MKAGSRWLQETFSSLGEAATWLDATRGALQRGLHHGRRAPAPALGVATKEFLDRAREGSALTRSRKRYSAAAINGYESALRLHVLERPDGRTGVPLKELSVDDLDARSLQGLVDSITATTSGELARMAYAAVSAVMRDLYVRGVVDELPARVILPPPNRGRERTVTMKEADALLAAAATWDKERKRSLIEPLMALLITTGCRVGELLGLTWGPDGLDIDHKPPLVNVLREETKTEAGRRQVVIEKEHATILRRHRLATGRPAHGELVFFDEKGDRLDHRGRVRYGIKKAQEAAKIDGVTPHVFRHSNGSWLAAAGESATVIAARLGHADPAFTMRRYVHPDREKVAGAADSLARARAKSRAQGVARKLPADGV